MANEEEIPKFESTVPEALFAGEALSPIQRYLVGQMDIQRQQNNHIIAMLKASQQRMALMQAQLDSNEQRLEPIEKSYEFLKSIKGKIILLLSCIVIPIVVTTTAEVAKDVIHLKSPKVFPSAINPTNTVTAIIK